MLEKFDDFAEFRNELREIALKKGEWAGIPMPLANEPVLVIEPSYPFAEMFSPKQDEGEPENIKIRNTFYSIRERGVVYVYQNVSDGRIGHFIARNRIHNFGRDLHSVGCSAAWGLEQEAKAVRLLGTLLRHHQFKQYLLTGMFLEKSKRSNVMYLFRKLKPTVALTARDWEDDSKDSLEILCTLCMHPIGYYDDTWAGAMCPTDDVIAHLMLMRGDEHMYWRRANQHPPYRLEAGL